MRERKLGEKIKVDKTILIIWITIGFLFGYILSAIIIVNVEEVMNDFGLMKISECGKYIENIKFNGNNSNSSSETMFIVSELPEPTLCSSTGYLRLWDINKTDSFVQDLIDRGIVKEEWCER